MLARPTKNETFAGSRSIPGRLALSGTLRRFPKRGVNPSPGSSKPALARIIFCACVHVVISVAPAAVLSRYGERLTDYHRSMSDGDGVPALDRCHRSSKEAPTVPHQAPSGPRFGPGRRALSPSLQADGLFRFSREHGVRILRRPFLSPSVLPQRACRLGPLDRRTPALRHRRGRMRLFLIVDGHSRYSIRGKSLGCSPQRACLCSTNFILGLCGGSESCPMPGPAPRVNGSDAARFGKSFLHCGAKLLQCVSWVRSRAVCAWRRPRALAGPLRRVIETALAFP
jgi:hypothetical protein